jgi:reductive dehalogenase
VTLGIDQIETKGKLVDKFHSTVSRRDFMKTLGLTGVGLGAAAAAAPVFRDLDEVKSAYSGGRKHPWWIAERDHFNPTTEVDWNLKESYDGGRPVLSAEEAHNLLVNRTTLVAEGIRDHVPGNSLKDHALMNGSKIMMSSPGYDGGAEQVYYGTTGTWLRNETINNQTIDFTVANSKRGVSRQMLNLPRYEGTPEENLNMLTIMANFFGSPHVGALEITDKTKKVFSKYSGGREVVFEDAEQMYRDDKYMVIPNSLRWMIVMMIPQSGCSKHELTVLGKVGTRQGYSDNSIIQARMAAALRTLGYKVGVGAPASNPGMGILSGLGELGRTDYMISPSHGAYVRYSMFVLTDLPLTPTKPIDFGMWNFCHDCRKCAEKCPAAALSLADEPFWEITGPWNGNGLRSWHIRYDLCLPWRGYPGGTTAGGCGVCQGACVFSKLDAASIHEVIKGVVATTGIFNGFFRTMDDVFGYGETLNPDDFWDINQLEGYPFGGVGATT